MKIIALLLTTLSFSCGVPQHEYYDLQRQVEVLRIREDSLKQVINELQKSPAALLAQARDEFKSEEFRQVKNTVSRLVAIRPTPKQSAEAAKLFRYSESKLETIAYTNVSTSTDVEKLKTFIVEYPKSRYVSKVRSRIKKYTAYTADTTPAASSYNSDPPRYQKAAKSSGQRVGAICNDGTRSYATGRGACSHHGGVREWLYD